MKHVKTCMYCATNFNLLPTVLVTPLYGSGRVTKPESDKQIRYAVNYGAGPRLVEPLTVLSGFRLALKLWNWHLGWEWHLDPGVTREGPDCM